MVGRAPVASVYMVPACLSVKAAKQKILLACPSLGMMWGALVGSGGHSLSWIGRDWLVLLLRVERCPWALHSALGSCWQRGKEVSHLI